MAQATGGVPVLILKEGTNRSTGKDAQRNNITAAKIVAETVRSTLGPRGMDKMLVSTIGDVTITNDGATIMKELDVQHPAAKMLVEVAKTQDNEVGDGTTTAVLLSGELLSESEKLLDQNVHPTVIVDGYKKAAEKAIEILDKISIPIQEKDDETLRQIATTAMYSNGIAAAMHLFLEEEEKMLKEMVEDVAKTGATVLFSEKGIDDLALHYLAKRGIAAVKNVSSGDIEKLSKATGGKVVASVKDLSTESLGAAKIVEEAKIGDDKLVYVRDAKNPKAVTIVIRGGTEHVVDEAERSLHDALSVVRNAMEDGKIVAGGGAPEAEVAKRLREYAVKVGGREQLAIEGFANALEAVPTTLAENAGLDPIDVLVELRSKHEQSGTNPWWGIDVYSGKVKDMRKLNVIEPLRVKQQVIKSASEAAGMILRIDDVIAAKGMDKGGMGGGKGGMPPGMGGMGGGDEEF